eukprot:s157_g26.t1
MSLQTPEVSLAKVFFELIRATDGNSQRYSAWSKNMVQFTLGSTHDVLTDISKALHSFCKFTSTLADDTMDRISKLGKAAAAVSKMTHQVMQTCVPGVLKGLGKILGKNLLRNQEFFAESSEGAFFPDYSEENRSFFDKCLEFCTKSSAETMKDTLISMSSALQHANVQTSDFDPDTMIGRYYMEHELQALCLVCVDNLHIPDAADAAEVVVFKTKIGTIEAALTGICNVLQQSEGQSWHAGAKVWLGKNVVATLMGTFLSAVHGLVQDRISAQPEGFESLLAARNSARLRQLVFSKEVHMAATSGLDEFSQISKHFDNVLTATNSIGLLNQSHVAKIKQFQVKTNRVKVYSSTVHGLNLCLHRFSGKGRKERSALLRESLGHCLA